MAVQTISNTYSSNVDISIPANARNITLSIAGGRGGSGGLDGDPADPGGPGGRGRVGSFNLTPNFVARTLQLRVGGAGGNGSNGTSNSNKGVGGSAGSAGAAAGGRGEDQRQRNWSGGGGGGGGASGVYDTYHNTWVAVSGGGGGGGGASSNRVGGLGSNGGGWSSGGVVPDNGDGFAPGRFEGDGGGGGAGGGGVPGGNRGIRGQDNGRIATGGGGGGSAYNSSISSLTSSGTNSGSGYITLSYQLVTPQINSFSANPNPQTSGSDGIPNYNTTLSWGTSDVTSVSINNSIGAVGSNGSTNITNLSQSTAGSNSPATRNYTLTACAGSTCVSQTITVSVFNDNTPNNYSISNQSNLEPNTLTTTSTTTISGIDMSTLATAGPGVQVSNNGTNWSSTTLITNNTQVFARATSPPFNTNPSGLTNSSQFYIDVGPVRRFFTLTTRAPDVNESFNLSNEDDRVPFPDIDTITTPPDHPAEPYISSNTLNVDDIEIPVEIKTNNSNIQIRVKRSGASSWENWQDTRSI
jgi:hypothetical protein